MPVKNAMPFLEETILSILDQSYQNWELIAVDDHSDDDSCRRLAFFAQIDKRVKVFQSLGNGIIPALQIGYKKSTGQYITRMDADDVMMPDKLDRLLYTLKLNIGQPSVAVGLVSYFSDEVLGAGYSKYAEWLNGLTRSNKNFDEIYKECVIPSPCWMMHRDVFESIGGFESEIYPEDYDLCFRMKKHRLKISGVDEILHRWRDHPERTSRHDPNYADNRFLDIKLKYFLDIDYDHKRPLIIWGAGKKAKLIAQKLIDRSITFIWACNNDRKIGRDIYGQQLISVVDIPFSERPQIIVLVANEMEQEQIKATMEMEELGAGEDYFLFC